MAYGLIKKLKEQRQMFILEKLKNGVDSEDRKIGKLHQVFESSTDIKQMLTQKIMLQKLLYIHQNPCSKKWMLATSPEDYEHNSASFYTNDSGHSKCKLTSGMELESISAIYAKSHL